MSEDLEWDELVDGLRRGDAEACRRFWERYGSMLEAMAHRQLSARVQRRVGPDDVVQSACRTFFRRVSEGQFDLPDAEALWRLMCSITLAKARRTARNQHRQKRSLRQEQGMDAAGADGERRPLEIADLRESPVEIVELSDQLENLLAGLSPEECQVLDLKMQQFTNEEIAEKLGCSERTIRRVTKTIQEKWTRMDSEGDPE